MDVLDESGEIVNSPCAVVDRVVETLNAVFIGQTLVEEDDIGFCEVRLGEIAEQELGISADRVGVVRGFYIIRLGEVDRLDVVPVPEVSAGEDAAEIQMGR